MLELQVLGRPAPQGSKRAVGVYAGKKGSADRKMVGINQLEMSRHVGPWRDRVESEARKLMCSPGLSPLQGPIRARMVFTISKAKQRKWPFKFLPAKVPDLSKILRSTEDALTRAGFWGDDRLVVEYTRLAKVYPDSDPEALPAPGVRIWAEEIMEESCAPRKPSAAAV